MANHRSAEKRHRQNVKRRARNKHHLSTLRNAIKKLRTLVSQPGQGDQAAQAFASAERAIRKGVTKGVLHGNAADRTISRLARHLNAYRAQA